MKTTIFALAAIGVAAALTLPAGEVSPEPAGPGWKLVWSDEFDIDGAPNPANWRYEYQGFLRNKEEQWYTNSPENIFVKDGMLHIVARLEKEKKPNPNYREGSETWKENRRFIEITSAGIVSNGRAEFKYGRIVMRARMPKGAGLWPAFWTIGADPEKRRNWPDNGEIDIVEYVGRNPHEKSWMQGALHWQSPEGKYRQKNGKYAGRPELTDGFHLYGIDWNRDKIDFFVDDRVFLSIPIEQCGSEAYNAFRVPHFLLLNLAVGGMLGGKVDRSALPAEYLVDYVRVYQKTE